MEALATGACYRCGYHLGGIADNQACPECGLLAERSRRISDELHQTRPRWLGRLSWGTRLILLSILLPLPLFYLGLNLPRTISTYFLATTSRASFVRDKWMDQLPFLAFDFGVALLSFGVLLLASKEGYPPADRADRRLRLAMRLSLLAPWVTLGISHAMTYFLLSFLSSYRVGESEPRWPTLQLIALILATLGSTPLPILLSIRFRGLARRVRSAHLAEHCTIVGIGMALTLTYLFGVILCGLYGSALGLADNWNSRGTFPLVFMLLLCTLCILFVLWAIYLLVRFGIAFARARKALRRRWRQDDRSLMPAG